MNTRIKLLLAGVAPLLAMGLLAACTDRHHVEVEQNKTAATRMEVFKQANCGCCSKWVDHLGESGFDVETKNRLNLNAIKQEFSIEPRYQSCHTGVVDGYIFEGHIPASLIKKFLDEKPSEALGLAVPGMPVGSPGMEMGERFDSYDVLLLKKDGSSEVYAHIQGPVQADQSSIKE